MLSEVRWLAVPVFLLAEDLVWRREYEIQHVYFHPTARSSFLSERIMLREELHRSTAVSCKVSQGL